MEQKDIPKCNKLIGRFMNKAFKDPLNYFYDKEWSWLMPVVEKIELLNYTVIIQDRSCYVQDNKTKQIICTAQFFTSKIETVYTAVVAFIEYFYK